MNYDSVYRDFTCAINKALDLIINNKYPSMWSDQGCGWQEQWCHGTDSKNYAGIYASCEGIIALREKGEDAQHLRNTVYEKHLCKIYDTNISVSKFSMRKVRGRGLFISNKLSHFILASSYIENNNEYKSIIENAISNLYNNYLPDKKMFAPSNKKDYGSVLATTDALVALHSIRNLIMYDHKIFSECIETIKERLNAYNYNNPLHETGNKVLVLWIISYFSEYFDEDIKNTARKNCFLLMKVIDSITKPHVEKFSLINYDDDDDKDYYSFNIQIKLIDSFINFIEKGYIERSYLSDLLEPLLSIADFINKNGYYSTLDSADHIEFWENYQSIELLKHYNILVKEELENNKGAGLMTVTPKIFNETTFEKDPKLVFIIMPFKEAWSDDVYNAFIDALSPHDYTVWRADNNIITDEIIMQKIWEQLNKSAFVIADCTGKNPNVFYELGIAHVLGKSVFMCAQSPEDFPFDVKHIKHFLYDLNYKSMQILKEQINIFAENI